MRSLCEDIAKKLRTVGYMSELNRIQVGEFSIKQAIPLEALEKTEIPYRTIEDFFVDKQAIQLEPKRLQPFLNGVRLTMKKKDDIYRIYCNGNFIGIGIVQNSFLKRDIIL